MYIYTAHEQAVIGMIALTRTCSIIYHGNVIFYVCLLFQEYNQGIKKGLSVL